MQSMGRTITRWLALAATALLVACGGGGGGSPPAPTYTIGGNVTVTGGGALAPGLVLQVNAGDSLARSSTGTFTFATPVPSSTTYTVTVSTQPATQNCAVTNGSGTVGSTNVTNVGVACTDRPTHSVGGTITNLLGTGLSLQLNGTSTLPISGTGSVTFTFATPIAEGNPYNVTVSAQPGLPGQVCSVTNGTGTMATIDITTVAVDCQLPAPKFAYVATQTDNRLTPYSVNPTTGSLTTVSTAPSMAVGTNTTPYAAVIDPRGRTVWVSSDGGIAGSTGSVTVFSVNSTTGALTQRAAVPIGGRPVALAFDPTGRFVYVAGFSGDGVTAIAVNTTTGLPSSFIGTIAAGTNPQSIKVDATGRFVYVSNATSNTISQFSISSTTGSLTFVPPAVPAGGQPAGLSTDPLGRFVYVANATGNTVGTYVANTTTGVLTAGVPAPSGAEPSDVALDPLGRFAYALNNNPATGNSVTRYTINASTGALTAGAIEPTGTAPSSATVDPSGTFLYVANSGILGGNSTLSAFRIDQTTGALTGVGGLLTIGASGAGSIAILPAR